MIYINNKSITGIYTLSEEQMRDIEAVYKGLRLVWSKLSDVYSCYSNGYWIDEYPWDDNNYWVD